MSISFLKQKKYSIPLSIVLVLFVIVGGRQVFSKDAVNEHTEAPRPSVRLLSNKDYALGSAEVRAVGQVEAEDAITFSAEASATVVAIPVELGQKVAPGQVLVELDHRDADAQLAQASAGVARARAALDQRLAGPSNEEIAQLEASVHAAEAALAQAEAARAQTLVSNESARSNAALAVVRATENLSSGGASSDQSVETAYRNVLFALRDGVLVSENALVSFTNAQYAYFLSSDTITTNLETRKSDAIFALYGVGGAGRYNTVSVGELTGGVASEVEALVANGTVDPATLIEVSSRVVMGIEKTRTAMDALRSALDSYIATGVTATDKATADQARAAVDGALKGINAALQGARATQLGSDSSADALALAYQAAKEDEQHVLAQTAAAEESAHALVRIQEASLASAKAAKDARLAEPRAVDLASYYASLDEAGAAYQAAATNRSRRSIVAPFAGEVAALPLRVGDLVNPGTRLVALVNTSGLQVKSQVSENDRRLLQIGAPVFLDGAEGVLSNIAPSVDPVTKKVPIVVVITSEAQAVTVGSSVEMRITATPDASGGALLLPLASVSVSSTGASVYRVTEESRVEAVPVEIGRTIGESVQILSGLTGDWSILASVRGIRVGDLVTVTE